MIYDTKTALVLRSDLLNWQIANVAAFLAGGIAGTHSGIIGEPYRDGDGQFYTPLIREPVFVYGADAASLRRTFDRAVSRGLKVAIYTEPLFKTSNDMDNRASVVGTKTAALDFVGIGVHADRKTIDKVVNGLKFLS